MNFGEFLIDIHCGLKCFTYDRPTKTAQWVVDLSVVIYAPYALMALFVTPCLWYAAGVLVVLSVFLA